MAYETIKYEVAEQILTITLNRPDKLNAFNAQMQAELIAAFDAADKDDDVRAIIVTGAGRGFCAGADLSSGADTFDRDASRFCPIKSEQWGYSGTLTLFDPPSRLDRIELTQTTEPSLAMGRFFARRGPSIYMCYAETGNTGAIRERLEARGSRYTAGRENGGGNLFIHPTALHGVLMGISRANLAWTWSGRPELARA